MNQEGMSVAPALRLTVSLGGEGMDALGSGGHEGLGAHVGSTLTPAETGRTLAWPEGNGGSQQEA